MSASKGGRRLWALTLGSVVLAAGIGTVIAYAVQAPNAPSLLIATLVTAIASGIAIYVVGRPGHEKR